MTNESMNEGISTLGMRPQHVAAVLGDHRRVSNALDQTFRWSHRTNVLEMSAFRVAKLLNCDFAWSNGEPTTEANTKPLNPAIVAFVEQWILDVATLSDATLADARDLLGDDGLMDFIHSLLVIEQRIRLDVAWQRLAVLPAGEVAASAEAAHLGDWGVQRALSESPTPQATTGSRPGDPRLTAALTE